MSFADAEVRANAAVLARLANATATVVLPADAAGQSFDGIFDAAYQALDLGPGLESSAPQFAANEADIPDAVADALADGQDVSLEIRGSTWNVVEHKPDGTGITVLRLRK